MLVGERKTIPTCLISTTIAFQLIREGCEAYLASIIDTARVSPGMTDIPIVRDFPEVFLDELSGLPPHREVDFEIETMLRTAPTSIAPYRMVPL